MADPKTLTDREAEHGQRMIEVRLRFWTNDVAEQGRIRPRHAWSSGVVLVERNEPHGISPGKPLPFHSLLDVGSVIEAALIEHGIVLHASPEMAKYFDAAPGSEDKGAGRRKAALKADAARTPEERSEAAKKANATRGAAGRKEAARKTSAVRSAAARSDAAKKASKTRREAPGTS